MQALYAIQRSHAGLNKFKSKAHISHKHHGDEPQGNFERLPQHLQPLHYTLCLKPNLNLSSYEGCVSIHIEIKKEAQIMLLHAMDLNISKIMWEEDINENRQEPFEYFIDRNREQLRIIFDPPLMPCKGCVRINFNGIINKKTIGFYHSKYISANGEELLNGVTKFDSTEARRCFPCWDEPSWKSTFDLSFIIPTNLIALSNMPLKVIYPHRTKKDLHVVEFIKTPLISTYLLGFVLGEFDYLESKIEDRLTVRVYTPLGQKEMGQFALTTCVKMLSYFENTFKIEYPLPKLDMVAINDLNSSAVGQWGLITFRTSRFLINEKESTLSQKIIARNIAHEVAHQWIGNLVTIDWWSNLWVYEAVVTFMEYVSVDKHFPEFDVWTQFLSDMYSQALNLDALKCSHPIDIPIHHPSEIRDIFDLISYCKSAAVMRMLYRYIGETCFKEGINILLTKFAKGNASAEDFWSILDEVSSKPVTQFMHCWTRQMGFPLLRLTSCKHDTNQKTMTLTVTQEKFWVDLAMRDNKGINKEYLWMIPLTMSIGSNPNKVAKEVLMERKSITLTIPNIPKPQWVKLNPGTFNYYRVKYSTDMLGHFMADIRNKKLPPMDRLGIIGDLLAMAECGLSSAVEIFSMLESYTEEDNFVVWNKIDKVFESLDLLLYGSDCFKRLQGFCRAILTNVYERVGWVRYEREKSAFSKLRVLVLNRLIRLGHEQIIEEGTSRYDSMVNGTKMYPPELRSVLYKVGLKVGTGETLKNFFKMYRQTDSVEEKERIAHALGECKEHDHIQDVLAFAISEDVKMRDSLVIFKSVGMRRPGLEVAWEFLKDHWSLMKNKYPAGSISSEMVYSVTSRFTSEEKALEVQDFFKDHPFPGTERAVQQALEKIRMMDAWLKKDIALVNDYLGSY